MQINFNIETVTDFQDSSAPFLLYNATRMFSLQRKYEDGVKSGIYPALPPIDQVDWSVLTEEVISNLLKLLCVTDLKNEWELLLEFILSFPSIVLHIACPSIPDPPA